MADPPGTLYVVATPIGNLGDISARAIQTLRQVDRIACEDTRHTKRLLDHFGIVARTVSLHAHNEAGRAEQVANWLDDGENIALVTDAGTPAISDPGSRVIDTLLERGVRVIPIPGPSAIIAALSVSGMDTSSFRFEGFAPRKRKERRRVLTTLTRGVGTLVLYESPRRILDLLDDIVGELGESHRIALCRELTKTFEEVLRGGAGELRDALGERERIRGEFTVLIAGLASERGDEATVDAASFARRLLDEGLTTRSTRDLLVELVGLPKREAYDLVLAIDAEAKSD